jgi:RNA polymerase sigma-70 factor (ECF subfamily)
MLLALSNSPHSVNHKTQPNAEHRVGLGPMPLETFPDEALLVLVSRGNQDALASLYDRYASAVLGLARRMGFDKTAQEDCVQEVFMRIWNRAGSFEAGRASGRSWVLAVAHHYCVDRVRQEASRPKGFDPIVTEDSEDEAFDLPGKGLNEEGALNRIRIQKALKVLSPDEYAVIEMLHYQGHTYPEAAKQLGIPLGTLKARTRRAMEKLREVLYEA